MVTKCVNIFRPIDIKSFSPNHPAYSLLEKGYEVSINKTGLIVDAWEPRSKVIANAAGEAVGTREESFRYDDAPEYFEDHRNTFKPADKDRFHKDSKEYDLLNQGLEITLGKYGELLEIRDPVTKKLLDFELNDIGNLEFVDLPDKVVKIVRNPLLYTNTPDDIDMYDPEHWHVAFLQEGYHVTVDSAGNTVDIWDPVTGDLYNDNMEIIGTRKDPYPSDNNIANLKAKVDSLASQAQALWQQYFRARGITKANLYAAAIVVLRERGTLLWQHGRLVRRKRMIDEAYQKRITNPK